MNLASNARAVEASPRELTAFVREVVLPGADGREPRLDPRACRFPLAYRASPIHRWGIFALQDTPARRRVIEYTGQRIDAREVWRRSFRAHLYVFWLNERSALDGAFGGSGAEFINHSCNPNLAARVGGGRIFLSSTRRIRAGEELTLDYHLDADESSVACTCGATRCRGFVGA